MFIRQRSLLRRECYLGMNHYVNVVFKSIKEQSLHQFIEPIRPFSIGDDREGLRQMLLGENPRGRRTPKLTEEAQLAALLHDDKHMSEDQRQRLQSQLEAIKNDATLTEEQKKEKIKSLVEVRGS